ncbi:MAG: hypothetical protein KJP08_01005 [Gammaproteobacteria bacterium]|nr:hypothetical protein [Gammaproteobacteria bacterium]NNF50562.1 hypothetical protein [Woeseiaceae bacterium]MBT8093361.1 hypothetical protein [Gammaproteobacteria bacterium]MBT8104384.1 hypothetical protein [Gammaproteobacteria bacterium]NNK24400.1 hypothetical protein [Woeseiaceae bacterium]
MKAFQITLLILFAAVLSTQAIRHVHLYATGYEEPLSVTAPGFPAEARMRIRMEESTDELMAEYEDTRRQIGELTKQDPSMQPYALNQENPELYARHSALAMELNERQRITSEIRDLWIFSIAGLVLLGSGARLYTSGHEWVGMSLIVPGFLELTWWSSPSFTLGGAVQEFDVLLINKIVLTIVSIALLYLFWSAARRRDKAR